MNTEYQKLQDIYYINQNIIKEYPLIDRQFTFWLNPESFQFNSIDQFIPAIEKNLLLLTQLNFKIKIGEITDNQLLSFIKSQMQLYDIQLLLDKIKSTEEHHKADFSRIQEIKNELVSIYENQKFQKIEYDFDDEVHMCFISHQQLMIDRNYNFDFCYTTHDIYIDDQSHREKEFTQSQESGLYDLKEKELDDPKFEITERNFLYSDKYKIRGSYFYTCGTFFSDKKSATQFRDLTVDLKQLIS